MPDPTVQRIRATARAYAEAVRDTQRYFDRVGDVEDPAVLAEYANLVEREKVAEENRLAAIQAAGIEVPSIDASEA
jgi:hypothetical protein